MGILEVGGNDRVIMKPRCTLKVNKHTPCNSPWWAKTHGSGGSEVPTLSCSIKPSPKWGPDSWSKLSTSWDTFSKHSLHLYIVPSTVISKRLILPGVPVKLWYKTLCLEPRHVSSCTLNIIKTKSTLFMEWLVLRCISWQTSIVHVAPNFNYWG